MKKNMVCLFGVLLFTSQAFGICVKTNYVLPQGGDSAYDDYLYPSTAKYEKRNEGQTIAAYVCGQGYCNVDDVIRLSNAAIGSGAAYSNAVFKCVNIPDADRTGYGWQATIVDAYCTVGTGKFKYNSVLKLYEYAGKYCAEINEVKDLANVFNITQTNIVQNITSNIDVDITEVYDVTIKKVKINKRLSLADIRKIKSMINRSQEDIQKDLAEIGAVIDDIQQDISDIKGDVFKLDFEIWRNTIADEAQSRRMDRFAKKIRKINKNLKQKVSADQVVDIIDDELKNYDFVDQSEIDNVISLIESVAEKQKADRSAVYKKLRNLNWRVTQNEAQIAWVRLYNNLRNVNQDAQIKKLGDKLANMEKEQLTESDVEDIVEKELRSARLSANQLQQVKMQIELATVGLKVDLKKLTSRVDVLEDDLKDVKTSLTKLQVQTWFDRIKDNMTNNRQDAKIRSLGGKIDKLKSQVKERPTEDDVMDMIQDAIDEADLNENQLKQVKSLIDSEIDKLGGDVKKLKRRLNDFAIKMAVFNGKLMWQDIRNNFQDKKLNKIVKNMDKMQDEVNEKLNEDQVMDLVEKALDGAELSKKQEKEVEEIILASAKKLNARMDKIDNRIKKLKKRISSVEWDVFKLKGKLAVVDLENDVRYKQLRAKDGRIDKAIKKINKKIKDINKELDEKVSREEAHRLIQSAVDAAAAELGTSLDANMQTVFSQIVQDLNNQIAEYVGVIENRLAKVEADVASLKAQNDILLTKISKVQSLTDEQRRLINQIRGQISEKTTPEEVVALIVANTQSLADGQKQEVQSLIVEYTKYLTDGQKAQIQVMISGYVDLKINQINTDMENMRLQADARDKIISAMSVLNAFVSGADVSVWKNKDGKFNTARLTSDAAAGVVLGTAGGLISNSIIKKNQIKSGFEDISCSVAGQLVADYADEFTVGMQ